MSRWVLDAVDLRDVRMIERGEHLGFASEPCQPLRIAREGVGEDLQRDDAIELGIARTVR